MVTLDGLDEEALIRILREPKNSLTKQYHKLFELDGVELDFQEEALEVVAKKSLERKTGARGLRAIMENSLMDLMYKAPSDQTIRKAIITKEAVEGTGEPEIIREEVSEPGYHGKFSDGSDVQSAFGSDYSQGYYYERGSGGNRRTGNYPRGSFGTCAVFRQKNSAAKKKRPA